MAHQNILKTFDDLYETVKGDKEDFINEDQFRKIINDLVDIGFICTGEVNDFTIYSAKNDVSDEKIRLIDAQYPSILIPQEGDFLKKNYFFTSFCANLSNCFCFRSLSFCASSNN